MAPAGAVTPRGPRILPGAGDGPRLPLLIISPYARVNFVDHATTDVTSILRFVEDNWGLGRLGDQSFDEVAGPVDNMFDFKHPVANGVRLDPRTGETANKSAIRGCARRVDQFMRAAKP